jgi:hypothetical protein
MPTEPEYLNVEADVAAFLESVDKAGMRSVLEISQIPEELNSGIPTDMEGFLYAAGSGQLGGTLNPTAQSISYTGLDGYARLSGGDQGLKVFWKEDSASPEKWIFELANYTPHLAVIYAEGLAGPRNYKLPLSSGTLALTTDTTLLARANHTGTQAISTVDGLQSSLDGKAASAHTHAIADVTNLQTTLDGKASSSHSHAISDVTNLQTSLDAKAASTHSHAISDVTSLQSTLDAKAPLASPTFTGTVGFNTSTYNYTSAAQSTAHRNALVVTEPMVALLSGPLVTDSATTGRKAWFRVVRAFTLTAADVSFDCVTAPTGSAAQADILRNGGTIYSTKPTIDAGEISSSTGAVGTLTTSPTSFAIGDIVGFHIHAIGSTVAGAGYSLTLNLTYA